MSSLARSKIFARHEAASGGGGGGAVSSFNGRTGAVVPIPGDYPPVDLAYADIITETVGGNLKDGQIYHITSFPAFTHGVTLIDLYFIAFTDAGAAFPALRNEGVGFYTGVGAVSLSVDWYGTGGINVLRADTLNVEIREKSGSGANFIDLVTLVNLTNSDIENITLSNFDPSTQSLSVSNSRLRSGTVLDLADFNGTTISDSIIGSGNTITFVENNSSIQACDIGSNNTFVMPTNGAGVSQLTIGSGGLIDFTLTDGTLSGCIMPNNFIFTSMAGRDYIDIDMTKGYFAFDFLISSTGNPGDNISIDIQKNELGEVPVPAFISDGEYRIDGSLPKLFGATAKKFNVQVAPTDITTTFASVCVFWTATVRIDVIFNDISGSGHNLSTITDVSVQIRVYF